MTYGIKMIQSNNEKYTKKTPTFFRGSDFDGRNLFRRRLLLGPFVVSPGPSYFRKSGARHSPWMGAGL